MVLLLLGCENSARRTLNVLEVQKIDADTQLKCEYFAYTGPDGREVRHGKSVLWYQSGGKYLESNYSHGELDGRCVVFSEDGKEQIVGWYRHGKPWQGEVQFGHEIRKYSGGKLLGSRTD